MRQDTSSFKKKLENQHTFPGKYIFKFIVPSEAVKQVEVLCTKGEVIKTSSSKGKYTSVKVIVEVDNADEIMDVYRRAAEIESCISL